MTVHTNAQRWRTVLITGSVTFVLLVAFAIRLPHALWNLPYLTYWDEFQIAGGSLQMIELRSPLLPFFNYGAFPIEFAAVIALPALVFSQASGDLASGIGLRPIPEYYWSIGSSEILITQRSTWLLVGLVLIGLVMMIGARLGGVKAAVTAGLLIAVSPLAILTSSTVMVDGFGTTWATLAVLLAIEAIRRSPIHWWLVGSAIAAGLAAATKIPYGSAVLAPLTVAVIAAAGSTRPWAAVTRNVLPIGISFPLTFALVSPNVLKWPRDFVETLLFESRHYGQGVDGASAEPWVEQFLVQLRSGWIPNFGILALGLAVLGLLIGLSNSRLRIPLIVLVTPTLPVLLVFMSGRLTYHRTLIFTYPAIAVLAGLAATLIARWVYLQLDRRLILSPRWGNLTSQFVWMAITVMAVSPKFVDQINVSRYWWTQTETRTIAFATASRVACQENRPARIVWQRSLVPNGPHLNSPCPQVSVLLSPLEGLNQQLVSGDILISADSDIPALQGTEELQSIPGNPLRPVNEFGVPIGPTENPAINVIMIK